MKSKLGLASVLFIGASLLLKVSGLIRDMVIAYYFGDSYIADAYLAAFIIPNMFILFMTTGMKNAFVPSYIEALEENRGNYHFGQVMKGTNVISLVVTVLGMALAPYYIPLLYPEFSAAATEIAVWVSVIFFATIMFVGINAVLEAYFDAKNKFSLSMVSQIIVIVASILAAFLFARQIGPYSLALGYTVGTVLSLLFKWVLIRPAKAVIDLNGKLDWLEVKHFYFVFIPVGLTVAVGQINLMVGTIFASQFQEGAVTYINYAKNLVHMPQGIFGVTIATIIFPMLSKAIATDDNKLFKKGIEQGLTTMYFILLPSIVGMLVLMPNIIALLYQRGEFTTSATMATTQVAYLYFGSVLFFSLNNVINKGFYSLKKGNLILMISLTSILLNFVLNYIFTAWIGYRGIPLAASVNALFYVGAQLVIFLKLVGGLNLKKVTIEYIKITAAVLVMVAAILPIKPIINDLSNLMQIVIVGVIGAIVYVAGAYVTKVEAFQFVWKKFVGKKGRKRESTS
ncbi:murein biosynthesis integral membrane protein MurJ [Aquibacillus salsiterrae]|uniref:Lipid II flippase n=1 Tax=Aquibacillus salsiterrae TaxID=2950439 RepID=A0A9X3WDY9_9BACI|nr:murein biosynthesis integral membrane protein MurJ [Aquibacillus salsiterrae]MDC3416706.1 murein biosynthesis integral membrane protein MurJ [Aquibacillus salsiterrae]